MAGLGDEDLEEEKSSKDPAPAGSLEIELDDPDKPEEDEDEEDEDDDPAPAQTQNPEQTPRKQKRAQRAGNHRELERQLQEERARREGIEARLNQLQGFVTARQPDPGQADPSQRLQSDLDAINEEQAQLYRQAQLLGDKLTQDDYAKINRKANDLEVKKHRVMNQMVQLETRNPMQERQQVEQQVFQSQLNQRYPDLVGTHAGQWGMQRYHQLLLEGKKPGWETLDMAADDARKQFGLAGRARQPAPTPQQRSKLVGTSKGGAGGGNADKPRTVRLSKDQLGMVERWNPTLFKKDEKAAARLWWKTIGSKHA